MQAEELQGFLERDFAQVSQEFAVEKAQKGEVRVRLKVAERHLRPGGTVSGPSMFALADVTIYLALLSQIGPKALSVTTNCSIDFLRKPSAGQDLIAEGRLLKLGKTLAVGDVLIFSEGKADPVARAGLTYSIPPDR